MSIEETVRSVIEPLGEVENVEIVDVEHKGATLRITVDQQPNGIGTEALARITRAISRAMDEHDPVAGRYTLEISSPGLERPLRTPDHFNRAIGETVKVKTSNDVLGQRRFQGELVEVSDTGVLIDLDEPVGGIDNPPDADEPETSNPASTDIGSGSLRLEYHQIDKARTVFEWGPTPKPGSPEAKAKARKDAKKKQKKLEQQKTREQQEKLQQDSHRNSQDVVEAPQDAPAADHKSENTGAVGS